MIVRVRGATLEIFPAWETQVPLRLEQPRQRLPSALLQDVRELAEVLRRAVLENYRIQC